MADSAASNPMRSLSRAIQVLEQLQRYDGPRRLKVIAEDCGMSSPTALRILRVLCGSGLVNQSDKSYSVGPGALPAARSYLETDPLPRVCRPVLQRLAADTEVTASLYSRLGFERVLIERSIGSAELGYELPQGRRLPLTVGAGGKALIRDLPDGELASVLAASVTLRHEAGDLTLDRLKERLTLGGDGYSLSSDEREIGVVSVAVPIPTPKGWAASESIALSAPISTVTAADLTRRVPQLHLAARTIAESLPSRHA
ncbi:IclR family transcriptional regulator [Citricoccus sp. NPDC055426]|uniref:IclR family transcriptional regulator n=1 Tax=Citricoccus sp. NPDC055426 TaxID=3155536 RepID=UPI00343A586C